MCCCRLGLIPLVSNAVHQMKGPFDDIGEQDFTDVELSLNILCTSEDTIDVTSNDFVLDQMHPEVYPVGESLATPTSWDCHQQQASLPLHRPLVILHQASCVAC